MARPGGSLLKGNHTSPGGVALRITSFALLVGLTLGACAILPGPAFSRVVQTPASPGGSLAPGDGVAVLAVNAKSDHDSPTACVRNAMRRTRSTVSLVPPQQFRDASLPGFQVPFEGTSEDLQRVTADPLVQNTIARLGVRYVIGVRSMATTEGGTGGAGVGVMWQGRDSTVAADVWDLKDSVVVGTMAVGASGKITGVGIAPGCAMLSVISVPMTETVACNALGRHLAEFLTGAQLPTAPPN